MTEAIIKQSNLDHSCQSAGAIQSSTDDTETQRARNVKLGILGISSTVMSTHQIPLRLNTNRVSLFLSIFFTLM